MSKLGWWKTACVVILLCAAAPVALPAQTFTTLHSFDGADGDAPFAPLMQADNGSLYGTTGAGGAQNEGTVFMVTPSGKLTNLYSFCSQTGCADGEVPYSGLVQATDRNFYGTTYALGLGGGTVFKITPGGTLTTVYSFCSKSSCSDGKEPVERLIQAANGNLYGATIVGGVNATQCGGFGCGTVFELTPSGALTTLYSFCSQAGCTDGAEPFAGPVQGTDGNFYGATEAGGAFGAGTIFRITPTGTLTTLYGFCSRSSCADGSIPSAALIQATDGDYYGTTVAGGANSSGTIFRITASGTLTTLYSFCSESSCKDGAVPNGGLIEATDGNFYGVTSAGGVGAFCKDGRGCGTIFSIARTGTLSTLYSFCSQSSCPDGTLPDAALLQDTSGVFYGTTGEGGVNGLGTIFSLSVGLGPFVETEPAGGKVGAAVKILGTNLTGATNVTFNGAPATFTVEASSVIKATVPTGATTGTVQVVTPSGTLSSNAPFRVKP